jgi:hypothetical protein
MSQEESQTTASVINPEPFISQMAVEAAVAFKEEMKNLINIIGLCHEGEDWEGKVIKLDNPVSMPVEKALAAYYGVVNCDVTYGHHLGDDRFHYCLCFGKNKKRRILSLEKELEMLRATHH